MRILGAGDNVADRYLDTATLYPGGNALNVAVFCARQGAEAGYLGVLGDDPAGSHILKSLQVEHVDTSMTRVVSGPNATADVELQGNDRAFLRSNRSTALFDLEDAQLAAMGEYDIVHSGYAGTLREHIPRIAERAAVSFDFGNRFVLEETLPSLEHLFLASYSTSHLSQADARSLVERGLDAGATNVLATHGADGALFGSADGIRHQPADVIDASDTLGAGDAFIAGVLTGLAARRDMVSTLVTASAQAAQACQYSGAFGHGFPFNADEATRTDNGTHDKKKAVEA